MEIRIGKEKGKVDNRNWKVVMELNWKGKVKRRETGN